MMPAFGERAYGPGADTYFPPNGEDGPVETSLPDIPGRYYTDEEGANHIVMAKKVLIHPGGALLLGHTGTYGGENDPTYVLDFGYIKNNSPNMAYLTYHNQQTYMFVTINPVD